MIGREMQIARLDPNRLAVDIQREIRRRYAPKAKGASRCTPGQVYEALAVTEVFDRNYLACRGPGLIWDGHPQLLVIDPRYRLAVGIQDDQNALFSGPGINTRSAGWLPFPSSIEENSFEEMPFLYIAM